MDIVYRHIEFVTWMLSIVTSLLSIVTLLLSIVASMLSHVRHRIARPLGPPYISINFRGKPIKFCSSDRDFIVFVQTVPKL